MLFRGTAGRISAMIVRFTRCFLTLALAAAVFGAAPARADGNAAGVYARMQRVNAGLQSYQADLHVEVTTHGFPFISPTLEGKAYFQQPDKNAVVFDTVPVLASQFKKVYPQ